MRPEPESEEAPLLSRDDEGAPKVPFRSGTTTKGGAKRPDGTAEIESYFRQRGQHRIGVLLLRGAVAIAAGVVATTVLGCATMANLITVGAMPISVYFMLVWTAHTIAALFHVQALLELRRFLAQPSRERGSRTLSRRERIPFAKAVLSFTARIAILTILAVTTECLLLSHLSGGAAASAVVCPIWVGCAIVLVQGLLCRFTSTAMMFDAVLVIMFCSAVVQKVDDHATLLWAVVLIPVLFVLVEQIVILAYWMLRDVSGRAILSPLQRRSCVQYIAGLAVLFTALVLLAIDLDRTRNAQRGGRHSSSVGEGAERMIRTSSAILLLFSEGLLISAGYQVATAEVERYSHFVGEAAPLPLAKFEYGWDVTDEGARQLAPGSLPFLLGTAPGLIGRKPPREWRGGVSSSA